MVNNVKLGECKDICVCGKMGEVNMVGFGYFWFYYENERENDRSKFLDVEVIRGDVFGFWKKSKMIDLKV